MREGAPPSCSMLRCSVPSKSTPPTSRAARGRALPTRKCVVGTLVAMAALVHSVGASDPGRLPNSMVERTGPERPAAHHDRYPVVRLCLASLSAHEKSAPVQFMVGL